MRLARMRFATVRLSMSGAFDSGSVPFSEIQSRIADRSYEIPLAHRIVGSTMILLVIGQVMAAWSALRGECIFVVFFWGIQKDYLTVCNCARGFFDHLWSGKNEKKIRFMQFLFFRAVQIASESIMDGVFRWIRSFVRRRLIGVWMLGMEVPVHKGCLLENTEIFLKNSGYHGLEDFFKEKPRGATVFWTPERMGKSYTLTKMGLKNTREHRFMYFDFSSVDGDAKKVFYHQLGLDSECDIKPLSTYLPSNGIFFTFIFDHFDRVVSQNMIASLVRDSVQSSMYNLLILVNDSLNAHSVLNSCGQLLQRGYTRLLGPPFCGRWSSADLGALSDERYNGLVDQCGSLVPMIHIRNGFFVPDDVTMLLRIAKLQREWEQGERLLGQYRRIENLV